MTRKCLVSKDDFIKMYSQSTSILDLSIKLGLNKRSVQNYINRYGLMTYANSRRNTEHITKVRDSVFFHYRGQKTINDLAIEYGLQRLVVRRYIEYGMSEMFKECGNKWPIPSSITQVKIVKLLIEAEETGDDGLLLDTQRLAEYTCLPEKSVNEYIQLVMRFRKSKSGRRKLLAGDNINASPINQLKSIIDTHTRSKVENIKQSVESKTNRKRKYEDSI